MPNTDTNNQNTLDDSLLTDTSVKRTSRVGPCLCLFPLFALYKTVISVRWTLSAGPKGVRLGGSWLYSYCLLFSNDNLPSSETQGQSVGREEKARRKFTSTCNGPGNAGSWTGRKNALRYCARSVWVLFVSSYMTAFVSQFLSWQSSARNRQSNAPGSYAYNWQGTFL